MRRERSSSEEPLAARISRKRTRPVLRPASGAGLPERLPPTGKRPSRAAIQRLSRYQNRELAWLDFNARVLKEAQDPTVPLLERLKFLAIVSSNLDEFFMIRVAGIKRQIDAGVDEPGPDGLTPAEVFAAVSERLHRLVAAQHRTFDEDVAPRLAEAGIRILTEDVLNLAQREFLADYFRRTILPVVTPLAIDPGHPFPRLLGRTICLAVGLEPRERTRLPAGRLAFVHIPSAVFPRFVRVPSQPGTYHFVALEETIRAHIKELFTGYEVTSTSALRVTRDADLQLDEDNAEDLLKTIEEGLRARRRGAAVRLQYEAGTPRWILDAIVRELDLVPEDLYPIRGCIAFSDLFQLCNEIDIPELRDKPFTPQRVPAFERSTTTFDAIRQGDILVHHPYQSFDYVVRFVREAAEDPAVLAIKMTLYRVGGDSPVMEALARAAQNGKQVAVLMELKARFDEQANIEYTRKLEEAGAHVIYGLPRFKTHCKALLVVRREAEGIRRYCHLSTGNYNHRTALVYTDLGMFSCREDLCEDVSQLFNAITGYCRASALRCIAMAPTGLRKWLVRLIRREAEHAEAGRPARIVAKLNAVEDWRMIEELYEASYRGVQIDLLCRGICCLRPGLPGLSDRIKVTRIVDRFLEHSRILYFFNGGRPEYFLGSADFMPRNLDRRIEVVFPVLDPEIQAQIEEILALALADNVKAHWIGPDGTEAPKGGEGRVRFQERMFAVANRIAQGLPPELKLDPPAPRG